MTPDTLKVTVHGHPAPQGSKRHVGNGVMVEASTKLAPWRTDVQQATLRALAGTPGWRRDYTQVWMHVIFYLPRPQAHYAVQQGQRSATTLVGSAPVHHATRPDLDKLLRSTFDALTIAGAYVDDCRIVSLYARKVYAGPDSDHLTGAHLVLHGVEAP